MQNMRLSENCYEMGVGLFEFLFLSGSIRERAMNPDTLEVMSAS